MGPVMKICPVIKDVGRRIFFINCLYGAEMRGEQETEGVMGRELRDVCNGYRIREMKECTYVCGCVCVHCSLHRELQWRLCADHS